MKYGYSLMGLSPRHFATIGAAAEEAGFESIWLPEHLVYPETLPAQYPYSDSGLPITPAATPLFDPWVALAFIASATQTIKLATNVYILPLRHPIAVARQLVTLDRVSGGRVILGAGVGWLENEFNIMGLSFADRGKRMDESMALMRRLWSEKVIEHHGDHFDLEPVYFEPKPVQKAGIPIEIGGASPPALRRAGRLGDGWIEIGAKSLDDVADNIATIQKHRRDAGREGVRFDITLGHGLATSADELKRAEEMGVTRLLTSPPFPPDGSGIRPEAALEFIAEFGRNVIRGSA